MQTDCPDTKSIQREVMTVAEGTKVMQSFQVIYHEIPHVGAANGKIQASPRHQDPYLKI